MNERFATVLRRACDTRELRIGPGALAGTAEVFSRCFPGMAAILVADENTFAAAGRRVSDHLGTAGLGAGDPIVLDPTDLHAEYRHVEYLSEQIDASGAIPVAVGSGTINDLTKLAAYNCRRPYMVVATAASMDGYTAYGASITKDGSKQTFYCPAPRGVIADMDVLCAAPGELNAAGYGDLLAKVSAGADWLLADALGIEPIEPDAWSAVQDSIRIWTHDPAGVRRGDRQAIESLMEGLLMAGFAMQTCRTSRPASGAEHHFSHLWDMQHHRYRGRTPLHGCKVAIGTLAVALLYEELLDRSLDALDITSLCAAWPDWSAIQQDIAARHELPELRAVALRETKAKWIDSAELRARLERLAAVWPALRDRIARQLIPSATLARMLREAGAPHDPRQIGIDFDRLRRSYREAWQTRARYTVLDLAVETGLLDEVLERLFAPGGRWDRLLSEREIEG